MNVISSSYGNDSIALIQWAHENNLPDVIVAYCDTGWAAPGWDQRVAQGEFLCDLYGFEVAHIHSIGMEELVKMKKGWPCNQYQFCTMHLKGVPFLEWLDPIDPTHQANVLIGKRRAESKKRADTPCYIMNSEYHGERMVFHPLYLLSHEERDELVKRAGMEILPHRSQECSPCVNANRDDFLLLTKEQIENVNRIECDLGKPMIRPKRYQGMGIYGVMMWAKYGTQLKRENMDDDPMEDEGCGSPFGCGL